MEKKTNVKYGGEQVSYPISRTLADFDIGGPPQLNFKFTSFSAPSTFCGIGFILNFPPEAVGIRGSILLRDQILALCPKSLAVMEYNVCLCCSCLKVHGSSEPPETRPDVVPYPARYQTSHQKSSSDAHKPSANMTVAFPLQLQTPSVDISSERSHWTECSPRRSSDLIIVVIEVDIPGSQPVALHELIIARRSLILCVAG